MALEMLLRRKRLEGVTVHGFRSTFRDWCGNRTSTPRELAEHALSHVIGDKVEQAYRRDDAFERRRRPLMESLSLVLRVAWARQQFRCVVLSDDEGANSRSLRRTSKF